LVELPPIVVLCVIQHICGGFFTAPQNQNLNQSIANNSSSHVK
jgi:hypothetical protein